MQNQSSKVGSINQTLQQRKLKLVGQGKQLVDLSMINPDLAPPRVMMDRLIECAMRPQNHRYSVARGLTKLREAFCGKYKSRWSVELNSDTEICITSGSKEAVLLLLRWCIPEHSQVLLPAPYYPAHLHATELGGHEAVFFNLGNSEAETLGNIEQAIETHRPAVLLLNFPSNPTGAVVSSEFYMKLATIATAKGTLVYNDFVYGELEYNAPGTSLLSAPYFKENGLESYSISKAYSSPGWRVASMSGSARWIKKLSDLKSKTDYGLFIPIQVGAIAGLSSLDNLTKKVADEYKLRGDGLLQDLGRAGFRCCAPKAGCSLWIQPTKVGVEELLTRLLDESGVLLTAGEGFGNQFSDMIRVALVAAPATLSNVAEALSELHN